MVQELGPRHPWSANGHGNMAEVFFVTGDYERALTHFETALSIRREALGNETIWVPHTLAHLGDVQYARGEFAAAIEAYGEGLELRRGSGLVREGHNEPQPAVFRDLQAELQEAWLRRGLALALAEEGRLEEALEHARAVADSPLPRDRQHADLTGRLDVVGQVLLAMGDHEAAQRELETATARMIAHYGADHRFIAEPLTALARTKLALGKAAEAAELAGKAIAIRDVTPRANLRSRAFAEQTLAKALDLLGTSKSG
jgi:tetratricopeptide (TPR) repeat protein